MCPVGERGLATRSADLAKRGLELLVAQQARTVRFPEDQSLGTLYVRDTLGDVWLFSNGIEDDGWEELGEARGVVTVPPGKILKLEVSPPPKNLRTLSTLSANDLQALATAAYPDRYQTYVSERIVKSYLVPLQNLLGLQELQVYSSTDVGWVGSADASLAYVGKLHHLERLRLFGSAFTDNGLMHLRSLSCLRTLVLELTHMTGVGLAHLQQLPKLEHLALPKINNTHTALSGAALAHLSNLESIRVLSLAGIPVKDIDLVHLQRLTKLEDLDLSMPEQCVPGSAGKGRYRLPSFITDAAIPNLQVLTGLRKLCLSGTQISDAGFELLTRLLSNCEIER